MYFMAQASGEGDLALAVVGGGGIVAQTRRVLTSAVGSFGRNTLGAAERAIKITKTMSSTKRVIAEGRGIQKVDTLVEKFGGKARGWKKYSAVDDAGLEVHWYEHAGIGKVGIKYAGFSDPF